MEENKLRKLFKSKELALGMFVFIPSEAIVDLAGYAGFNYVLFDTEHASYDIRVIENLQRTAEAAGLATLVRISNLDPYLIARVLDTGVDGVHFARISTREQAEQLVKLCRIPPVGERGACPGSRSAKYRVMPMNEYHQKTNDAVISIMIESKEGIENAEEILSVPGIDGVAVGVDDLCTTLGVMDREDPLVWEARSRVIKIADSKGITFIAGGTTPEILTEIRRRDNSVHVFNFTTDAWQIANCFQGLITRTKELASK